MKCLAVLVVLCGVANADDEGAVFVAQPVRSPVALDNVRPVEPFVPANVPEVTGKITIGPDRAAALWIDPLDVIAIRHAAGAKLAFARVVGEGGARATIAEAGSPVTSELVYLTQVPGRGDVWTISASAQTTIVVERPVVRSGRMIWETTQRAVLAWIDHGGKRPELPIADGSGMLGALLDAYATVGAGIEASDGKLRGAVRAWRKAHAIAGITSVRPFVAPQLAVKALDSLSGMGAEINVADPDVAVPRPYHRISGPRTFSVELTGPGALRVELRGVLPPVSNAASLAAPSPAAGRPVVAVGVAWSGRTLAQRSLVLGYATTPMPAPPAFPHAQPLVSQEGVYVGDRVAVTIPLFPGTHHYDIAIDGGDLAMRATVAQRRVTLSEFLTGVEDVDRYARNARSALGANKSPAADLVRRLVATLDGSSAPVEAPPQTLPALLRLAWLSTNASKDGTIDGRAMTADERTAAWTIVADAARHARNPIAVAKLVAVLPGEPPPVAIPSLVMSLPRATAIERIRNWRLSAIDLARRAEPLDAELAFANRTAWRGGEWALIPPAPREGSPETLQAKRWLVETTPIATEPPRSWRVGDLWRLAIGKVQRVDAVPSTIDPARAAVLDIYVAAPREAAIELVVDGERFPAVALSALERLQVAVAPGQHTVQIGAPSGSSAWVSHAPPSAVRIADTARVQHLWPVEGVRTTLPDDARSSPIEVVLRATAGKPVRVTMKSDVGAPLAIDLVPGDADVTAHPLPGSRAIGGAIRFAVRLAPGARSVWFEAAEPDRVLAAVSVRRERADATPAPVVKPETANGDAIARVAKASAVLADDPDDARMRAERASDLLDLGEPTLAREDLLRLLRAPAARRAASAPIEDELFARLEGYTEPTHVALATPPAKPVALSASLVTNTTAYRSAREALAAGDDLTAAAQLVQLYSAEGKWQIAFEAVDVLARVLASKSGNAALAYGIAARLRAVLDHPRVRRTLVVAAAQSGWDTILSTTANGGSETVFSPEPILPPAPPVVIREALIAPPWPARAAHTITANTTAVLDLDVPAPTAIRAQVKCVRTIEPEQPSASCTIGVRIDQSPEREMPAQPGRVADLELGTLPSGRHVVELSLASEGDIASVRFVSDRAIAGITGAAIDGRYPIEILRRAKVFVATPKSPIAATVLGKTTLWIQARSLGEGARVVHVTATPATGAPVRATIELPRERSTARGDTGRDLVLSAPADAFLLLPEGGPYQVRVETASGDVVARIARREERKGKVPRVPQAWYLAAASTPAPFAVPTPSFGTISAKRYAEPSPSSMGTLFVEVEAGREALPEEDLLPARALARIDTSVGFRRMLADDRAWFSLRALGRVREDTALVAGGSSDLYLDHLPLGLAMQVGGSAFTQTYSDGRAFHVRGDGELLRRFAATSTLTVTPSIGFAASYLNTTPETVAVTTDEIDPDVFSAYRYTHDRAARARLAFRWMPLQDFIGGLSVGAATNADIGSVDYVDAQLRSQHLLPLAKTLITLGYRPRYRFSGDDRPDSFLQHYLTARLEWSIWTGGTGRFVVGMWNDLDILPGPNRNAFGAGLRYELLGHRGLVDRSPDDLVFGSLIDRHDYAPLEGP